MYLPLHKAQKPLLLDGDLRFESNYWQRGRWVHPGMIGTSLLGAIVPSGATILGLAFVMYLSEKREMNWRHGLFLLLMYIAYLSAEMLLQ